MVKERRADKMEPDWQTKRHNVLVEGERVEDELLDLERRILQLKIEDPQLRLKAVSWMEQRAMRLDSLHNQRNSVPDNPD